MTIDAKSEAVQQGGGDFHDVVALQFSDGEAGLFGFLRIARSPADGKTAVIGLLFGEGRLLTEVVEPAIDLSIDDWSNVDAGPAKMETKRPLERWTASLTDGRSGFDIALEAATPPLDLADPERGGVGELAGVREYVQMCNVTGTVQIEGRSQEISCTGWRGHVWGAPDWSSIAARRSIYFGSPDGASIAILGGRPAGTAGHDDDVSEGALIPDGGEPQQLDEILWSTVYDEQQRPDSAGLELYLAGDEFARRMSGKAIVKASLQAGGREHHVSFFRWSLDGRTGWGTYQSVTPL